MLGESRYIVGEEDLGEVRDKDLTAIGWRNGATAGVAGAVDYFSVAVGIVLRFGGKGVAVIFEDFADGASHG